MTTGGIKDFLDMITASVIDFKVDHFLCGNTYRCVWALREYPTSTDEQAILRHLGEMDGVTIRIYTRQVTASEEKRIIHNAANRNRMSRSSTEDLQQTVTAEANLQDVVTLVSTMHRNREPLLHCAVFLELTASSYDALKLLQTDVLTELVRSKLNVDRLLLRQREGFVSVMPSGWNHFGEQFERVLPASSVANLYPFNYSGKTDPHGFYIGKDKYGANILVDFDKRDDDKTSASILILGNSGQGKSYLLKLLLLNFLEAGKSVISLDVEHEQQDMQEQLNELYAQRVPLEQQEKIQQALDAERLESQRNAEASARYAGLHITENGQEHYLSTKSGQEFLDMAILMRRYVRGTFGDKEKGFARCIYGAEEISPQRFEQLAAWRLENFGKVTGLVEIDFDKGLLSALNIMDGWQSFRLKDVSSAAYFADKSGHVNKEVRWNIFLSRLEGKQLTSHTQAPVELHGSRRLRPEEIIFLRRDLRARRPIELLHGLLFQSR